MMPTQNAPYRAHLTALGPQPLFLDILEQQLSGWLLEKRIDVPVSYDNEWTDGSRAFEITHHERGRDHRDFQALLIERSPHEGDWTTEVLASSDGWVDVHVRNSEGRFVAVPRLVRYLLQVMELGDANLAYVDDVREIDVPGVEALFEALESTDRQGLVFVAGSTADGPGDLLAAYAQEMPRWAKETYGLASFVRLTPDATELFASLAPTHAVAPWTIRTFYPKPVLGDSIDARRHKYLTTRSLADMPTAGVAALLGTIARGLSAKRGDLPQVIRTRRAIERLRQEQLLAELQEEAPPAASAAPDVTAEAAEVSQLGVLPPEPEASADVPTSAPYTETIAAEAENYLRLMVLLREVLGVDDPTEDSLRKIAAQLGQHTVSQETLDRVTAELQSQNDRIDRLLDDRRTMESLLEDDQLEVAELREYLESREAENRWLRGKLSGAADFEAAYSAAPPDDTDYPDGFGPLLARLAVLTDGQIRFGGDLSQALAQGRIVFTGNRDVAVGLDDHDSLETAVRFAWDCLLVLADYIHARDAGTHDAGVTQYLGSTPPGYRQVSPKRHAPTETAATMQQYGKHRVFCVPGSVRPSGRVEMVSHFKLARIGMVSPRLYYFDNYINDSTIYIGYIGPHLPNTKTN